MGACHNKNIKELEVISKKDFKYYIPINTDLPKQYNFNKDVFFDIDGISAFLGNNIKTRETVVVKKFFKNDKNQNLYFTEIIAYNKLKHPNLQEPLTYFQTKKYYFIIFRLFDGKPVYKYLNDNSKMKTLKTIRLIIHQILKVLDYMHVRNFIHKQIDDTKIIFDGETVVVTGLGNCRQFNPKYFQKNPDNKFKKTFLPIEYQSPEVIKQNFDEKSDIWSLGVLAYVLITGQYPFRIKKKHTVEYEILESKFDSSFLKQIKIPKAVISLITSCLIKDPQKRPSAAELLKNKWFLRIKVKHVKLDIDLTHIIKKKSVNKGIIKAYFQKVMPLKYKNQLKQAFNEFDKNGNGYLTFEEFNGIIHSQNINIKEGSEKKVFKMLDANRSGFIEYDEFMLGMIDYQKIIAKETLDQIFDMLDVDQSKILQKEEIQNFVDPEYRKTIGEYTKKYCVNDGGLDKIEFYEMMQDLISTGGNIKKKKKINQY